MQVMPACLDDIAEILVIYNQGIEDRIATLEVEQKDRTYMDAWFQSRSPRYAVLVAKDHTGRVAGWASLNAYSHRCAYAGVADLSIYIRRENRGQGVGTLLLEELEHVARQQDFYKIVLFTFPFNPAGQQLYRKRGFREVGVFRNQGKLDGQFVDVMAMEKLLV